MYPSIGMDSQISAHTNRSNRDYADDLLPGYRFCPTDQELIVNYLQPKLESRKLPPARIHETFIYDYNPEELARKYLSAENKWYFMTVGLMSDRANGQINRTKHVGRVTRIV
ncbi:NAC domain-containing protein [Artemisia annua]|uniref:NAC domain-containing protein n=1 Tax=Artemisia annua TaxID=35608 RepID=A0A2U1K9B8_ARTAN|nr:NAC domain-containing protein [Artemisia annua]